MTNVLPIRHVLCPMDLSPISMNALEWANAVARARSAELRMFHVVRLPGVHAGEGLDASERDSMMATLRNALNRIDPGNGQVGAAIRQGDPGGQILQFARHLPADVIVMGAAGAERSAHPIGSVTAVVVARSDCSVLIVPAGGPMNAKPAGLFRQIVCALDLAPSSVTVMRQALSLGWETHAHVTCVCVVTEPVPRTSDVERHILAAVPPEAHSWCDIAVLVKPGVPATEIVTIAEASAADLLVIGPPRRWRSTTEAVLAKSLCPVLVTHEARPVPYPPERDVETGTRRR